VAQASASGVITVYLLCVYRGKGGGTGEACLEEVSARGCYVVLGVMVISVDVHMGVDQVVGLSIECSCEVVLPLLCVGGKVSILSGEG